MKTEEIESALDRLNVILEQNLTPALHKFVEASKDKNSEAIQQRSMMIIDIREIHQTFLKASKEFKLMKEENKAFIEAIRQDVLTPEGKMPKELFTEQTELFEEKLKPLIERYEEKAN